MIFKNQARYTFLIEFPVAMSPQIEKYCGVHFALGKTGASRDFFVKQQPRNTKDSVAIAKQNPYLSKPSFKRKLPQRILVPPNTNTFCGLLFGVVAGAVVEAADFLQRKYVYPSPSFSLIHSRQFFSFLGYVIKYKLPFSSFTYLGRLICPH